ncbi:T9SS type A sorting domain-containing protein [Balneolales bacterium ANBcel1]|nr:T9SS type A sorting domain-containing protein [Balneolales bacterium ANBcel1]
MKPLRILLATILVTTFASQITSAQEFLYAGGPLNETSSWVENGGAHPDDFSTPGQQFRISDHDPHTDGDWTLSGEGSSLIIDTDEDIVFAAGYTVTLDGITISFTGNAGGDLEAQGDLTLAGTIAWEYDDTGDVWSFDYRDDGDQTITAGEEAHLLVYNFRSDKEEGSLDLVAAEPGGTVLQTYNNFRTNYRDGSLFRDNGNRIVVGDDIRIRGGADNYDFTGTLEHRVHDGNSDYEEVVAELNNLYIHVRGDGNPRFRDDEEYTRDIIIRSDLIVDMESSGDFEFNDVRLTIGEDFRITHHRPAGTGDDDDAEMDMDDAEIHVGGDFIVSVSKEEPDGDENIDMDDAVVHVTGNLQITASDNGEFDFDASSVTVEGDMELIQTDYGIIDLDESVLAVDGNLLIDVNGFEDFEMGEAVVTVGGHMEIIHHRPEGADGNGEVDADDVTIETGGDFIIRLSKFEEDGDENIDIDNAVVTVGGNFYVFADANGEFDLDDSRVTVPAGYVRMEASENGIIDLDNGTLIVHGDVTFVLDGSGVLDLDDSILELSGSLVVDAPVEAVIMTDEFTARFFGDSDQSVSGLAGRHYHVLEIDKDGGHVSLPQTLTVNELFFATLENNASLSDDGGNIRISHWFALQGHAESFDLQGSVTLLEVPEPVDDGEEAVAKHVPGSHDTADDPQGELRFEYQQVSPVDVAFELFVQAEMDTASAGNAELFTLSEINAVASGTVLFSEAAPVFLVRQQPEGPAGQVILSELTWRLPDDDPFPTDSETTPGVPEEISLEQNYPNPFNPATTIRYELPEHSDVRLAVYDLLGRQVASLVQGQRAAGRHQITFDASHLSSGAYIYRLEAGGLTLTRQMMLLK